MFVVRSQIGFVGSLEQSELVEHSTQAPAPPHTGWDGSRKAQVFAEPAPHAEHVPLTQIGLVASIEQSELIRHSTQAPVAPHTGWDKSRRAQASADPAPHAEHVPVTQIGFVESLEQSELVEHSTQAPVAPHTGWDGSREHTHLPIQSRTQSMCRSRRSACRSDRPDSPGSLSRRRSRRRLLRPRHRLQQERR